MGTLSIVSTPIGNLEDITIRAIKTLFAADIILCEDTRKTGLLLHELAVRYSEQFDHNPDWKPTLLPYHDHNELNQLPIVIEHLQNGLEIALTSDAGTPLVSDPGFRIVRECIKRNIRVVSIPGPSAVLTALTVSGLPPLPFHFYGYLHDKKSGRLRQLNEICQLQKSSNIMGTHIFYCSPHKLIQSLEDLKTVFGDIDITIARELTKVHEQTWKGRVDEAIKQFAVPKGEFVLLFEIHN